MNRVIVITGANNGIGFTLTRTLLEIADRVAALDLETDNLASHLNSNLLLFRCDVTQPQQIQSVVDANEIIIRFGCTA